MSFETLIDKVTRIEGGYSNNPNDSGGETNWGVTKQLASEYGYTRPMVDMTKAEALAIYKAHFWDAMRVGEIEAISPAVALEVLDTAVNTGRSFAAKSLQRVLNVLNRQQKLYVDITADGRIGPATISSLTAYFKARPAEAGTKVILRLLNSLQGAYYVDLAERREKDEEFVYGWAANRLEMP